MTPILKDTENAAAPSASGVPATSAPKAPADAAARPQPVALEVPVTVNGARTVDGSDKREPFSEKSATVLVFGHGAVIRISAVLAPGQLIFLTNEKTRKEVVCQVVKSKTDGNAIGYVELRFTEPAPGFWGMRFPSDTVLPQTPVRPAVPAPVPAPPKVAPPAPPVAVQPVMPQPLAAISPVAASPAAFSVSVPSSVSAPPAAEPKVAFPTPAPPSPFAPPPAAIHSAPVAIPPAIVETPSGPVAAAPVTPSVESKPAATISSVPSSSGTSTEELKQQAARLQEQLSSLLFTESFKPVASVPAPATPLNETASVPEAANRILEFANLAPDAAPAKPIKITPPSAAPKVSSGSLEVEEIKIPSWLAPLARETDASSSPASPNAILDSGAVIPETPAETILAEAQESTRRPETAVFGGQLLGESSQPSDASASKSKAGLFIGIAASLLLVAGGVWYSNQPGNAISGLLGSASAPTSQHVGASSPAANSVETPAPSPAPASSNRSTEPSRVNPPAEPVSAPTSSVDHSLRSTGPASAPVQHSAQPAVEEPKKPSLGDVHLAAPTVNHGEVASSPASAPAIEINSPANNSAPVSSLSTSNRAEPVAPVPIGGDVKPAKLLKSVPPIYPDMARNQRISGDVRIDALVDADGNVSTVKVLSGSPLLHQAALNALKQWKYQPAELDGKPTSMHLTVTIQFRTQ
jgi:TonB family protein